MKALFTIYAILTLGVAWSQSFKGNKEPISTAEQSLLSNTLSEFSVVRFNTAKMRASIREQKSPNVKFKIDVDGKQYDLQLVENEIRGAAYKEISAEGGKRKERKITECHTYKGTVNGDAKLKVRLLISDELFIGYIVTPSGYLHFEPIQRFSSLADSSDRRTLVFKGDALKSAFNETCHSIDIPKIKSNSVTNGARVSAAIPTSCRILELATEADQEWFNRYGSQSWDQILAHINQVEDSYETNFNMRITLAYMSVWTGDDPYSASGSNADVNALNELRNYWDNAYTPYVKRDLVHMFTGRSFNNGSFQVRGIHFNGSVCVSPTYSYGFTVDGPYNVSSTVIHEIGHGFSARHPDEDNDPERNQCGTIDASVMCRGDKRFPPYFSAQQLGRINTHIQNIQACLLDYSSFGFDGPDQFCNSATFTANSPRNHSYVIWTSSSNISLSVDLGSTHTAQATSISNGPGWIRASFDAGCPVTAYRDITVNCGGRLAAPDGVSEDISNILVYPNPTTGRFKVKLNSIEQPRELLIKNIAGRQVFIRNMKNRLDQPEIEVDLGRQAAGTYFIQVFTDTQVHTKKIVIGN